MSLLEFRGARLAVRLGCGPAERASPQAVDLDVAVRFADLPPACESDKLKDTVCYADLIAAARARVAGREFHLVEHLAHELLGALRPLVPPGAELWLRVTKLRPPVPDLAGGVAFSLGDFERLPG
ncbi:MAG TPA: dihydroneopterin aldolase [Myxococcota bacterium]|nr:dihydroneopterin aldolase [Myxococcota bacterium]